MLKLIEGQKKFYQEKYGQFGDDPRALGYNDAESQRLRFKILCELFRYETNQRFSVHEVGCGLAHFGAWLQEKKINSEYSGSDISGNFIEIARAKFPESEFLLQNMGEDFDRLEARGNGKDYYVLSGTFNPMNETPVKEWEEFVLKVIGNMFRACRKGIAFNLLTSYSHEARRSKSLYYSDPKIVYDWCKTHLSRFVTVIEDTPLYEFTVLVYKEEFIRSLYASGFDKYFRSGTP